MNIKTALLVCFSASNLLCNNNKVLIITYCYNRPDFIEIQNRTFKHLLEDKYEYVVFNDASNEIMANQISDTCQKLQISCIRVPQTNRTEAGIGFVNKQGVFWAAARHIEAIHYSMTEIGFNYPGIVMMVDSDIFLLKKFSPTKFLSGYDMAGLPQIRGKMHYLWAGLILFRMDNLPNKETMRFNNGTVDDLYIDTGGYLHYYLENNPQVKVKHFREPYRHFIDENLNSYILPCEFKGSDCRYWHYYYLCKECRKTITNTCYKFEGCPCTHPEVVLHELGLNKTIFKFAQQKNLPVKSEFVMKDTFIHYQESANYHNLPADFHIKKTAALNDLINALLVKKN